MTATRRRSSQFQSTLPRRERRADGYERLDVRGHISIHAPAKGATAAFSEFPRCSADFNPRSREGSDILTARKDEHCFHFQSTLPRRERRNSTVPHSRPTRISIHAPAKGATRQYICAAYTSSSFQSTLPRRERLCTFAFAYFSFRFQSTLPRRERHPKRTRRSSCRTFQSTLPRRERRVQFRILAGDYKFQSTLPRRERQQQ